MSYFSRVTIAVKELKRSKKHKFLMLAIGCVTFFIIVGRGYQDGIKKQLNNLQYYGYTGDFIIVHSGITPQNKPEFLNVPKDKMIQYEYIEKILQKEFSDIKYIFPRYVTRSITMGEDDELYTYVNIVGLDIKKEYKVGIFKLLNFIEVINSFDIKNIYISNKIAKKLNLKLKDNLYAFIVSKTGMPVPARFKVAGIFEAKGFPALMDYLCFVEINEINNLLKNSENECSYLQIILRKKTKVNFLKEKLSKILEYFNCSLYDFNSAAPFFGSIKEAIDYTSFVSLFLQYLVLFLFIYSSIHIWIISIRKEIGIMYVLGLSKRDILCFFLTKTLVLIFFPSMIGLCIGFGLNFFISFVGIPAANEAMRYMFASDKLYFDINIFFGVFVLITMLILGILASIIPIISFSKTKEINLLQQI